MFQLFLKTQMKFFGLGMILLLLIAAFISSIIFGRTPITLDHAIGAFLYYDSSSIEHMIIQTERLPRAVIATMVGASLAVAGALMQALTRNPLASPSVFGINAGAIFFIVIAVVFLSISSLVYVMWFAFLGAAIGNNLILTTPPRKVMKATAANEAPLVIPMISGEANGFRIIPCNMAPDMPKAAPTNKDARTRGNLNVWIIKSYSPEPLPKIVRITSKGVIIVLPIPVPTTTERITQRKSKQMTINDFLSICTEIVSLLLRKRRFGLISLTPPYALYIQKRGHQ